tara:strand:+ start:181 stop:366 length:186 start_codon:yes stop_codon:yes gene_type:complete
MTTRIKPILKTRPKIFRESKKQMIKRKVEFKDNEIKHYFLSSSEKYMKIVTYEIIKRQNDV